MANAARIKTPAVKVYCRSEKRNLSSESYDTVHDLRKNAFALYQEGNFDDENAILTCLDESKTEVLLDFIPDSSTKTSPKELFIRFVCTYSFHQYPENNRYLDQLRLCLMFESIWSCRRSTSIPMFRS